MTTNVNINSTPSKALLGDVHTFVNRCLQQYRRVAQVGGQFVSAFGVVGFSGVKDSRKSVQIAEASASACNEAQIQKKKTQRQQKGNNWETEEKQTGDRRETESRHSVRTGSIDER
ncbi:MAG: hypothetical protein EPO60_02415 [Rugosibacter sp.]|nr:MAG: hypothetical protein EPO60_02415 [Rugosibacter sp.]